MAKEYIYTHDCHDFPKFCTSQGSSETDIIAKHLIHYGLSLLKSSSLQGSVAMVPGKPKLIPNEPRDWLH